MRDVDLSAFAMCEKNTTSTWRGLACTFNFYQTGHVRNFKSLFLFSKTKRIHHFHKTTKTTQFSNIHVVSVDFGTASRKIALPSFVITMPPIGSNLGIKWAKGPFSHGDGCEAPTFVSAFMAWIAMRALKLNHQVTRGWWLWRCVVGDIHCEILTDRTVPQISSNISDT